MSFVRANPLPLVPSVMTPFGPSPFEASPWPDRFVPLPRPPCAGCGTTFPWAVEHDESFCRGFQAGLAAGRAEKP